MPATSQRPGVPRKRNSAPPGAVPPLSMNARSSSTGATGPTTGALSFPTGVSRPSLKGMILAAGFGTRMLPLTRFLPKALLPVAGRPLLEWNLLYLAGEGIEDVVVNAHHLAGRMEQWAGTWEERRQAAPNALPGVRLVAEPTILGTAGGIAHAAPWLDTDPVVVVNVDLLFRPSLTAALALHDREDFSPRFSACATRFCPSFASMGTWSPRSTHARSSGRRTSGLSQASTFSRRRRSRPWSTLPATPWIPARPAFARSAPISDAGRPRDGWEPSS